MRAGLGKEVLDLYEWLPPHGENQVSLSTKAAERELLVTVRYDGEAGQVQRDLHFKAVSAFYRAAFPGPDMLNLSYSTGSGTAVGSLIVYPDSEAAAAWTAHYGDGRVVKHYSLAFLAENILLVVFAEGFMLGEAVHLAV